MSRLAPFCIAIVLTLQPFSASALVTAWDESVSGDLSSDPNAPTTVSFSTDTNRILGTVRNSDDVRDYWTFTLAPGQQLTNVLLQDYRDVDTNDPGNRGFHAVIAGPTSLIPDAGNAGSFLGGDHLDPAPAGTDLLPDLASGALAGTGFAAPLGPGTYTYLVQQTGPQHTAYTLDFVVVPEPATLGLLAAAGGFLLLRRRRRS